MPRSGTGWTVAATLVVLLALSGAPAQAACPGQVGERCPYRAASIFAQSAPGELGEPLDAAVAPDGRIVVADSTRQGLSVFGPDGRFLRELRRDDSVRPGAVAITPDGLILAVADQGAHLDSWKLDGTFVDHRVLPGTVVDGVEVRRTSDLEVAADGSIWVAYFQDARVERIALDGTVLEAHQQPGGGGPFDQYRTRVAVAPDGTLLVGTRDGVRRLSREGAVLQTFTGVSSPEGITVDPVSGEVRIATVLRTIARFSPDGTLLEEQRWTPERPDGRAGSGSLTRLPDGSSLVSDPIGRSVVRVSPTLQPGAELGRPSAGALLRPQAVWPEGGSLLVADTRNARLVRFGPAGDVISSSPGPPPPGFYGQVPIYHGTPDPDGSGSFVIGASIQRLAADGSLEQHWERPGTNDLTDIAADPVTGRVYVVESSGTQRVLVYDRDGALLTTYDGARDGRRLDQPSRLAVLRGGEFAVSHALGVDIVGPDLRFRRRVSNVGTNGMTGDPTGRLWMAYYNRVLVLAADGTPLGAFGQFGEGLGQFITIAGMAWHEGSLYVTDPDLDRVVRLEVDESALRPLPRPPAGAPVVLAGRTSLVRTPRRVRAASTGSVGLRVSCAGVARSRCRGTVRLRAASGSRTLGSRRYDVAHGRVARVTVRLNAAARRTLRRRGTLRAVVRAGAASRPVTVVRARG